MLTTRTLTSTLPAVHWVLATTSAETPPSTAGTERVSGSLTFPATSTARYETSTAPSPTTTGSPYVSHSPSAVSARRYSTRSTPEPASAPARVTVRSASSAVAVGTVASILTTWATSSETLPASSDARKASVCSPSVVSATPAVYGAQAPSATLTSIDGVCETSSVAVAETVTAPVFQPDAPAAGSWATVTTGACVSSSPVVTWNQSNATVTGTSCSGPMATRPKDVSAASFVTGAPRDVQFTPPSLTQPW
ncbi:hypothetical protein D3C74_317140 [compost metagenome]